MNPAILRAFSQKLELPIVELESFIDPNGTPDMAEAEKLVSSLKNYGALAVRDPRVNENDNQNFLNMMEDYFESRSEIYYDGGKLVEAFPEHGYQVGVTPENKEVARGHVETIEQFFKEQPVRS
jgi:hypothetical protein